MEIVRTAAYENNERAWVGDRTPYQDCRHLLPNHYLDCATGTAHRYFPSNGPRPAPTEVVAAACDILEATIRGVVEHWPATLAVTAG